MHENQCVVTPMTTWWLLPKLVRTFWRTPRFRWCCTEKRYPSFSTNRKPWESYRWIARELPCKRGRVHHWAFKTFQVASAGNAIRMGALTVTGESYKNIIIAMDMTAMDELNSLDQGGQTTVLQAVIVLYSTIVRGIMAIKAERNSWKQEFDALPPHTPRDSGGVSTTDFVRSVSKHKKLILHSLGSYKLRKVADQHSLLVRSVARGSSLKTALAENHTIPYNRKLFSTHLL